MKKRILSFLLVVAMVVAVIPATMIAAFAEESETPAITYVLGATLDGKNTDGEYDSATKVMLNAYGNDTDGDNMRIVYTDEAVYVLIEVFDDTLVRYGTFLDDGTTKAGSSKCDFVFLGFSLGTSFQGMKRVYRDENGAGRSVFQAPGASVNMANGGSGTLETKYFGYTEDENGFRLEARFPVSEMSARDQALYAAGQLELRFTAGTQDSENKGTEFALSYDGDIENRGWDGAATEDYFESGSYKAKNPSNYPEYKFEFVSDEVVEDAGSTLPTADYMAYVTNATLDGKNTNGEYDNTYTLTYNYQLWSYPLAGCEMSAIYSNDGIYIYLNVADTTANGASDYVYLHFGIGTSYRGTYLIRRSNTDAVFYNIDGTATAVETAVATTDAGWTAEIKFPAANFNETDAAAFAAGTLTANFGGLCMDNWANISQSASNVYGTGGNPNAYCASADKLASYPTYTLLEKFAVEDKTVKPVHYIKNPTLDGVNSNGEYDNSYGKVFDVNFWSAPSGNESMKVMYSDSGIYLLLEYVDDVAASDDFSGVNFRVGTSYVGYLQFNRLNGTVNSAYTNAGEVSMSTDWMRRVDAADRWTVEIMFPVDSMNATDKAAFAAGTIDFGFSVVYVDGWGSGKNGSSRTDANAGYSLNATAYNNAPALTIMPKGMVEDKTVVKADMTFISDAKYDGLNTNGEYDKAETILFDQILTGTVTFPSGAAMTANGTTSEGSYYKVIYADDGIYVFVNIADTTPSYYGNKAASGEPDNGAYGRADQFSITYTIGTSFIGKDWGYRHGTMGATNTGAGTLSSYPSKQIDNGTSGWTYEIKFPYSGMTAEDQAAFAAETLEVKFSVTIVDNYAQDYSFTNGVLYTDGGLYEFNFAAKGTNYADKVVFDGVNTDREYNTATTLDFGYGHWGATPNYKQSLKVVYAPDAIYVLAEATDSTLGAKNDFFYVHFRVGSTFVGSKLSNRNAETEVDEGIHNAGGTKTLPQTSAYVQKHFSDTVWSVELRFPVADLTSAEREAYAAGTLDVAFGASYIDDWAYVYKTSNDGYADLSAEVIATFPAFEFGARNTVAGFAGANLSLGENINVNYYANIPYDKAANAFVKFTYNGKSYIARPVAATNKIDYYVFTFEGLAPQCMGDEIDAVLMINLKAVDAKEDYSALQNCKNLLENEATPAKAKTLIYDLLAYGAAAQNYVGYKTDALVNTGYEDMASEYDLYPSVEVALDGVDTDGEYDGATTIALGNAITEGAILPSGSKGTFSGTAPTGSYYKVILTDNAICVYVNIADTTTSYYSKTADSSSDNGSYYYADQMSIIYSIGNSFIGKDWGYRHGGMGSTNTGDGTLASYPSKQKDNGAEGWGYEIVFPVSGMTAEDQAAYAAGTLSINFNVAVADNSRQGWGFSGVLYSDNTTLDAYTPVSLIDKVVGTPNVENAAFAAAGIYHANTNKIYAKVSFASTAGAPVDLSKYTVTVDGVAATFEATNTKGVYVVYTDAINVTDFDRVYTFVLSDGENTQTLEYSVNSYAIIKAAKAKTDKMTALAKAMYNYGVSAEAYAAN